jgi:hypothetical protein
MKQINNSKNPTIDRMVDVVPGSAQRHGRVMCWFRGQRSERKDNKYKSPHLGHSI